MAPQAHVSLTDAIVPPSNILIMPESGEPCNYCGEETTKAPAGSNGGAHNTMTYDHVIPVSLGGTRTDANRVVACRWCNSRKADMMLEEWVAWLSHINLKIRGEVAVRKGAAVLARYQQQELPSGREVH